MRATFLKVTLVALTVGATAFAQRYEPDMKGVTVMGGGGIEGYTGDLAPQLKAGPGWGVTASVKPSKVFGFELGYSGAVNEIRGLGGEGAINGADIVRNGGHAALSLGLATAIQPYVMTGIGLDRYSVRGEGHGFVDDTLGHIPVGAGLRTHWGNLAMDLRMHYDTLFDNEFAQNVSDRSVLGLNSTSGARYKGMLQVGGTF
jgi:hypothetical protein